jgi:TolB-like protein
VSDTPALSRIRLHPHIIVLLVLATALVAPSFCTGQDVKDLSPQLSSAITKSGRKTVAVVDFTDLQGCVTEFGRFLAEEFSVALATGSGGFEVIDRTNLKTLLQEHKLASTGIIDPQTARKVGEIAGVQALVTGTVTPFGDSVRLSVKVLDAETAKIIGGVAGDMPRNKAIDELLRKGISGGCQSSSEATPQPQTEQNGKKTSTSEMTAPPVSQEQYNLVLSITRCDRASSATVKCLGYAENQSDKTSRLYLNPSHAVDNEGNSVAIPHNDGIAFQSGDREDLLPKTPVKFFVNVKGISPTAKTISLQLTVFWGDRINFTLKDIRILQ